METIKLKEKYIERLNSHMWIFSNEIEKHNFNVKSGEIVKVEYADGKICGVGFYNPHSLISIRLLKKNTDIIEDDFFYKTIKEAYSYRTDELKLENGRMFFGESDGIGGLIIDKYNEVITVEILSAGVELITEKIIEIIKEVFSPKSIIIYKDHQYRLLEGLKIEQTQFIGKKINKTIITENGAKFEIDFSISQKTGFYYDQRDNREALKPYFKGKKVLDLYCYTGSFSIVAAKNEAEIVWGIDSSKNAIEMAEKNRILNEISEDKIIFKEESALKVLDALVKEELPIKPNFIIIDPPNFVRNKKHIHQAKRLYIRILKSAMIGIEKNGYIAFATCSQHISDEIFSEIIETAAIKSKRKNIIIYTGTQAKDHPIIAGMKETKYLRFILLKVI
jgi:23S rRNA (cytosine1962-C5)-methyltransferase